MVAAVNVWLASGFFGIFQLSADGELVFLSRDI